MLFIWQVVGATTPQDVVKFRVIFEIISNGKCPIPKGIGEGEGIQGEDISRGGDRYWGGGEGRDRKTAITEAELDDLLEGRKVMGVLHHGEYNSL